MSCVFAEWTVTSVFGKLSRICQSRHHLLTFLTSLQVTVAAVTVVLSTVDHSVASSANLICSPMICLNMSRIKRMKRSGKITLPCGSPLLVLTTLPSVASMRYCIFMSLRKIVLPAPLPYTSTSLHTET